MENNILATRAALRAQDKNKEEVYQFCVYILALKVANTDMFGFFYRPCYWLATVEKTQTAVMEVWPHLRGQLLFQSLAAAQLTGPRQLQPVRTEARKSSWQK